LYLPRLKLVFAAIKIETVTRVTHELAASRIDMASRKSGSAARGFVDCLIDAQVNCPIDAHVDRRSRELPDRRSRELPDRRSSRELPDRRSRELCASRIGELESAAAPNLRLPLKARSTSCRMQQFPEVEL
jgi:hypothetical protein